ncbi:asparagine synthase (glutamine-hydrolyzing) [Telmatocola sphagniphila]|uniref:asparagine synthase (glutamine-hydrolyzing) n=1 Tax=Telmatocola sphagniphila TaxID=1123043 RepID=A0A8E6B645_9BACT|nr:asparagine synthase (glutamine-hydrolyzing) [Telmatocola sphagniphila]QVL31866.1 asparagine synthase (glutamine-hydrolyzing) [Telmatocola sphagniphila]
MCGIAGAYGKLNDRIVDAVRVADATQKHRGPDDNGFWLDQSAGVALAHRRLSILDLSPLGHQPMIHQASGTVLIFNGEIYNYCDLRDELLSAGHTFISHSDTEVILKAYVQWGPDCIKRLEGMFALAVWNPQRRELLLARDPLGQKPFYYTFLPDGDGGQALLFSSELRSLLASGLVERKLSPSAVSNYVWNGFVPGPETIVKGVVQLPPGHLMIFKEGQKELPSPQMYWTLPPAEEGKIDPVDVEHLLKKVLKEHLATDVPLGVFLSGGIDSSAIAKMAVDVSSSPVMTFTIGFHDSNLDETEAASRIAAALNTDHTNIQLQGNEFLRLLPSAMESLDQPTFDGLNSYIVSRAVRKAGLTVALAGTGGDELFGGYRSFRDIPMANRWGRRLRSVPKPVRNFVGALASGRSQEIRPQTRWGKVQSVIETGGNLLSVYQLAYGLFTPEFANTLLGKRPNTSSFQGLPKDRFIDLLKQVQKESSLTAVSRLEFSLFLGDRLLRDTDAASMASSLEVRLPLLDRRVVEAVGKLSPEDRYFPLGQKAFLRERILRGLDPALFDSPKKGFVLPFETWCRGPLKPSLDASFNEVDTIRSIGLDPVPVQKLWKAFLDNQPGLYWSRIWSLHTIIDWCKRHQVTL